MQNTQLKSQVFNLGSGVEPRDMGERKLAMTKSLSKLGDESVGIHYSTLSPFAFKIFL